ncbi:histidine kinase [Winogradskyella sp. PC D3.3]
MITVIVFYLSLSTMQLSGQIMADSISKKINLVGNPYVEVLRTNLETSFEEIKKHTTWAPYDAPYKVSSKTAVWLKFSIVNTSKDTVRTYLYSKGHYVSVFQQVNSRFKKIRNGSYVPLPDRANKREQHFSELIFYPFQKSLIYVRLTANTTMPLISSPAIYSERAYWMFSKDTFRSQANSIGYIYFYIISLTTIFVFSLIFWLRLRKKLYLYYLGYLFFQIIYGFLSLRLTLAPVGNFFEYFPKLAYELSEPVQFVFIGFYVWFILKLLDVKKYDRLLAKILFNLGCFCFIYALFNFVISHFFIGIKFTASLFLIIRFIILPINFVLIFWIILKVKHPLLIYFIVGQTFFFMGAIVSTYLAYNNMNLIPGHLFNFTQSLNIVFQIGLLAEVYCFSLALGKNVFLLQKEKEKANAELIGQLQENQHLQETMNRELDEKVQKKTEELIQLYSEIERERDQKIKDDFNKKIKETEMIALRSQMNPHFIFNSMNAIKNLIMTSRNEAAITYLDDFASLLRGILQNSNRDKITVEEELGILELYLSLEKSRMGRDFNYTIHVTSKEELSQYQIPPLLLQPIVENAIWHGLHPSLKAEKNLTIVFDTSADLKIVIEDNGIGRKESSKKRKLHNSMGTTIVQDRLTLYNHLNDHSIDIKISDLESGESVLGTRITLTYKY